jgi:hypothetical protein
MAPPREPSEPKVPTFDRPTVAADSVVAGDLERTIDLSGASSRYRFVDVLGKGGMGEVRLCDDRRIHRQVAMKVLHKETSTEADQRGRFLREGLAQGQLEHPGIVPVYDIGLDEAGDIYFTSSSRSASRWACGRATGTCR